MIHLPENDCDRQIELLNKQGVSPGGIPGPGGSLRKMSYRSLPREFFVSWIEGSIETPQAVRIADVCRQDS
jgi:hypothetical protein